MNEIDENFTTADVNSDGLLNKEEFKAFVVAMNQCGVAKGLKNRDTTDEWLNMVYPAFNGYNVGVDGVTK